ncbi:MAG: hypothetical protein IPG61_14185 [bacterium]|nr:hypothetical protein [bacterium]
MRLDVYDQRGARLATLVDAVQQAGERTASWDGRDMHGIAVPSGVYLAKLETPTGIRSLKVTLAK